MIRDREVPMSDPSPTELLKDLTGSVIWAFQALMAAVAFSAIAILSHADWELLTHVGVTARADSTIAVPLAGLSVAYVAFFAVGPVVLFFMQLYLLIQSHAVLRILPADPDNGLLRNHLAMWPFSVLGVGCYAAVPLTNALFVWKIWPRQFVQSPLPPLLAHFLPQNLLQSVPYIFFFLSCCATAFGVWRDRRLIRLRSATLHALVGMLALLVLMVGLQLSLYARRLELLAAPLDLADLREFDLRGADFTNAHLSGARLAGGAMSGAILDAAWLDDADLRSAKLDGAILSRARLNGADLRGACLYEAQLDDAEIEGADFRYAWMPGAWLRPLPRTPADRTKMTPAERSYDEQGRIQTAQFADAKLCGAHIDFAPWSTDAQVGRPTQLEGSPFYTIKPDSAAALSWVRLPPNLDDAQAYPKSAGASDAARDSFRHGLTSQCIAKLLAKDEDFRGACPNVAHR
jgi:uncharacterized protein YjbI with pentapeptide repeats